MALDLSKHTLFQNKPKIRDPQDLNKERLIKYGDKIILEIPLTKIIVKPQIRQSFSEQKIKELALDILDKGLIHPVTVMKSEDNDENYILLVGGTRYKAFQYLNKSTIPAIVKEHTNNDTKIKLIQLAENLHRSDFNPVELANALMTLKYQTGYTLEQIAKSVGRTIDSLKQYSRIYNMTDEEKDLHIKNKSTKNDILKYLANKERSASTPPPQPFQKNLTTLTLNKLVIHKSGKNKDKKADIESKINQAQAFIDNANELLQYADEQTALFSDF